MLIRLVGAASVVLIVAFSVLDFTGGFWVEHPFVAAIVGGVLLLGVGVAIVDRYLAARNERRWRVVAAIALGELHQDAEQLWRALVREIGRDAGAQVTPDTVLAEVADRKDAAELSEAISVAVGQPARRVAMLTAIRAQLHMAGQTLARWGSIMLQGEEHVDHLNRFTGLFGRVHRLEQELEREEQGEPFELGEAWIAGRVAMLIDMATRLDQEFTAASRAVVPMREFIGVPDWFQA